MSAKNFYNGAYTPDRSVLLDDAHRWLMKAIDFEQAGEASKQAMAEKQALKKEREAFGWDGV